MNENTDKNETVFGFLNEGHVYWVVVRNSKSYE
jgi:hypothetical protein